MVHSKQASSIAISTGSRFMSFPCVSYAQLIPFVFTETVKKKNGKTGQTGETITATCLNRKHLYWEGSQGLTKQELCRRM